MKAGDTVITPAGVGRVREFTVQGGDNGGDNAERG
jgi:uncharacterized protein YjlB